MHYLECIGGKGEGRVGGEGVGRKAETMKEKMQK